MEQPFDWTYSPSHSQNLNHLIFDYNPNDSINDVLSSTLNPERVLCVNLVIAGQNKHTTRKLGAI